MTAGVGAGSLLAAMLRNLDARTRRLYLLLLLDSLVYGMVLTIFGAALPRLIRQFSWSYAATGAVLAASSAGVFLMTLASGYLLRHLRTKTLFVWASALAAGGLALFARWPSPVVNLLANLAIGVGQGLLEVAIELEVIHMERGESRLMNLLHAVFALGAIVGPGVAAFFLAQGARGDASSTAASMAQGESWQLLFPLTGGILVLVGILIAAFRFPRDVREARGIHAEEGACTHAEEASPLASGAPCTGRQRTDVRSRGAVGLLASDRLIPLLTVLLFFYVGSELGCSNWISEYFVQDLGASIPRAAFAVSLLWLGILTGRLAISFAWHGQRHEKFLIGLAGISAVALPLALWTRSQGLAMALVFATGLGFSGIYPFAISITGQHFGTGMAVGVVTTGAGLGSFSFPFLMSALAGLMGVRKAFLVFVGANLILVLVSTFIAQVASQRLALRRAAAP